MRASLSSLFKSFLRLSAWIVPVAVLILMIAAQVPASAIPGVAGGAIALVGLSLSLALAGRGPVLDRLMGGPDKAYVAHREAGYLAVFGLVAHWMLASVNGPALVPALGDLAEEAGVFAATGIVGLAVISALRVVPHHWWRKSHWLMGPLFAVSVFHSFFTPSPLAAMSAPWIVLLSASVMGLWGWARTLLPRTTPVTARVTKISRHPAALEIEVQAPADMPTFKAGQFQTLTVPALSSEPHPFSIAGGAGQTRRFGIGMSGDWTRAVHRRLKVGDRVDLGAPQGRFCPPTGANRKAALWLAGGVGITPFLAALETMEPDPSAPPVTLIYGFRGADGAMGLGALRRHAARLPQLTLVAHDSTLIGRLTPAHLAATLKTLPKRCDLYMCGPEGLKDTARAAHAQAGKRGVVRDEAFDFRAALSLSDLGGVGRRLARWAGGAGLAKRLSVITGQLRRNSGRVGQ